ncbi:MAG: hypothetical protein NTY32_04080 [Bacteroidia bacterium]|nr:hypothetical protein [Bacteroidia bacterium]
MKTTTIKRAYDAPQIEAILLDNEISLVLASAPGDPPDDTGWGAHLEKTPPNPFKENLA